MLCARIDRTRRILSRTLGGPAGSARALRERLGGEDLGPDRVPFTGGVIHFLKGLEGAGDAKKVDLNDTQFLKRQRRTIVLYDALLKLLPTGQR